MSNSASGLKSFVPFDTAKSKLELPPRKKIQFCKECGYFQFKKCGLGYIVNVSMKACHQAVGIDDKRKAF
jgi:hypothetical protein